LLESQRRLRASSTRRLPISVGSSAGRAARADLEVAGESAQAWREQLAAAPEDDERGEDCMALDEGLAGLKTTFDDLSARPMRRAKRPRELAA
jgi:hypothetical protein